MKIEEFVRLDLERLRLQEKELLLKEQRKKEIAYLAECYGILSLSNDVICHTFEKLAAAEL